MNDFAAIKTCRCDRCNKTALGLEYYHLDTPVLFVCLACEGGLENPHCNTLVTQVVFNAVVAGLFPAAA